MPLLKEVFHLSRLQFREPPLRRKALNSFAERGISFIEAPVSGTTPQAESAQLIYFVGGEYDVFCSATPILKTMGSALNYVGPLGSAALTKLTTNTLLGIQVTVIAELIGMLQRSDADTETVLNAVATTPVWSTVASRVAHSIQSSNFLPQFPIELIEKDFDYVLSVAGSRDSAPTIAAAHQVFKQAISQGFGQDNMTGVAKLFTVTTS